MIRLLVCCFELVLALYLSLDVARQLLQDEVHETGDDEAGGHRKVRATVPARAAHAVRQAEIDAEQDAGTRAIAEAARIASAPNSAKGRGKRNSGKLRRLLST